MNQLGKRYACATCEGEVLCVEGGDGKLECCGAEMEEVAAKSLPSSD